MCILRKNRHLAIQILDTPVTPRVALGRIRGRSPDVAVEAAQALAVFFCAPKLICGFGQHAIERLFCPQGARLASREEERCVSQARSSGSITPRGMGSLNARVAAMCSCTTPRSVATASGPLKRVRRS